MGNSNSLVGQQAKITARCQLQGKSGIVTWQDGNSLMVEIDGNQEAFALEMTNLYREPKPNLYREPKPTKPSCHYCGQDAAGHGFFDEPVCTDCGGK